MTIFKLFDLRTQSYLVNTDGSVYYSKDYEEVENLRWKCLRNIQPPNMLTEVIKVHIYTDGVFNGEVLDIHLN